MQNIRERIKIVSSVKNKELFDTPKFDSTLCVRFVRFNKLFTPLSAEESLLPVSILRLKNSIDI